MERRSSFLDNISSRVDEDKRQKERKKSADKSSRGVCTVCPCVYHLLYSTFCWPCHDRMVVAHLMLQMLLVLNPLMAELIFLGRSFYLRMTLTYRISGPVGFSDSKMHTATSPGIASISASHPFCCRRTLSPHIGP